MKLYNYAGYASQALADEYGRINREVAALNEKLKAVKEEMVFRDLDEAIGDAYQVTIGIRSQRCWILTRSRSSSATASKPS